MLWIKALHIGFIVCWFAGLFYLPRLFVNLAIVPAAGPERDRLLLMSRKLYRFMHGLAVLALVFGLWLWLIYGIGQGARWMHLKLGLVGLLVIYHLACGYLLQSFEKHMVSRSAIWYRWFNEAPVLLLFAILILVVVKPF